MPYTQRGGHQGPRRVGQRPEVVAAFQEGDQATRRNQPHEPAHQVGIVPGRQPQVCQRVGPVGVEAGRDQDPVRFEPFHGGHHHDIHGVPVGVARGAGRERHVDRRSHAVADPDLVCGTGTGIERPLVAGHEEDTPVRDEGVLGAVAVVRVDVDYGHPLAGIGQGRSSDRHVVQQAEAHGPGGGGVVSGGADGAERHLGIAVAQPVDCHEAGTGRQAGRRPGARAHPRVGIQPSTAGGVQGSEGIHVIGPVDPEEVAVIGRHRCPTHHCITQAGCVDALPHGGQAGRTFGMATTRLVVQEPLICHQQDGHPASVSPGARRPRAPGPAAPSWLRRPTTAGDRAVPCAASTSGCPPSTPVGANGGSVALVAPHRGWSTSNTNGSAATPCSVSAPGVGTPPPPRW